MIQVLEITDRVVVCLNLMDEAKRHGLSIDDRRLARDLGVPVVPTSARQDEGISELIRTIGQISGGQIASKPHRLTNEPRVVKEAINVLSSKIQEAFPDLPNVRWVALRMLEGDKRITEAIKSGELGDLSRGNTESQELLATDRATQ